MATTEFIESAQTASRRGLAVIHFNLDIRRNATRRASGATVARLSPEQKVVRSNRAVQLNVL